MDRQSTFRSCNRTPKWPWNRTILSVCFPTIAATLDSKRCFLSRHRRHHQLRRSLPPPPSRHRFLSEERLRRARLPIRTPLPRRKVLDSRPKTTFRLHKNARRGAAQRSIGRSHMAFVQTQTQPHNAAQRPASGSSPRTAKKRKTIKKHTSENERM